MPPKNTHQLAEHFFRHHYARMVAVLVRYFGLDEVQLAEDIVQDTLVEALEKWSIHSIPDNPGGWLMDVAKKKTINVLKRDQLLQNKILPYLRNAAFDHLAFNDTIQQDSTLRMIFTCCHPALPSEAQIALALKTLCGLSVSEIANALLSTEATINKKLYRAKQKFREQAIAFEIPEEHELNERLDNVYATLYLLYNEGYYSAHHEKAIRVELCFEAVRLLKQVLSSFPNTHKGKALLSLMLFGMARFESRLDQQGALIILSEQDRTLWDQPLIAEGMNYLHQSIDTQEVNNYQLQAGIAAEHCTATSFTSTNWESIYRQYSILEQLDNNPIIRFNKSIARFYVNDQAGALDDLLQLQGEPKLQKNAHYYTTLGVFHIAMRKKEKAIPYFETALQLARSAKEQSLIRERMTALQCDQK